MKPTNEDRRDGVVHASSSAQGNRAGRSNDTSYNLGNGAGASLTSAEGITILRSRFTRNFASQVCVCCVRVCVYLCVAACVAHVPQGLPRPSCAIIHTGHQATLLLAQLNRVECLFLTCLAVLYSVQLYSHSFARAAQASLMCGLCVQRAAGANVVLKPYPNNNATAVAYLDIQMTLFQVNTEASSMSFLVATDTRTHTHTRTSKTQCYRYCTFRTCCCVSFRAPWQPMTHTCLLYAHTDAHTDQSGIQTHTRTHTRAHASSGVLGCTCVCVQGNDAPQASALLVCSISHARMYQVPMPCSLLLCSSVLLFVWLVVCVCEVCNCMGVCACVWMKVASSYKSTQVTFTNLTSTNNTGTDVSTWGTRADMQTYKHAVSVARMLDRPLCVQRTPPWRMPLCMCLHVKHSSPCMHMHVFASPLCCCCCSPCASTSPWLRFSVHVCECMCAVSRRSKFCQQCHCCDRHKQHF